MLTFSLRAATAALALGAFALAQLPNDECSGAIPLLPGANGPFDTTNATTSFAWPCAAGGSDLWYLIVANGNGSVTIDTCGGSYDTALEAFSGSCNNLVSLACNDDFCGLQSTITFAVSTGSTYYIRLGGFASNTGITGINVTGPVASAFATSNAYGEGCYRRFGSFYELFLASTFDLSNTSFQMLFTGAGYVIVPGSNTWFTPVAAPLPLTDDSVSAAQPLGFTLPYPGGSTPDVWVSSNGFVWLQSSSNSACCNGVPMDLLTDLPRICPLWTDLNPSSAGTIHFDQDPANNAAYVTWQGLTEFGVSNSNTFQIAFFSSGIVEVRFQSCGITNHDTLTGWSPGNGVGDPGSMDLSAAIPGTFVAGPETQPLQLNAATRPVLGTTVQMAVSNVPGPDLSLTLISLGAMTPGMDLGAIGMPGCLQHIVTIPSATLGALIGNGSLPFALPNNPALAGATAFLQTVALVSGVNPFGGLTSNGVRLRADVL